VSHAREDAERFEFAERSKIMLGRTPTKAGQPPGPLWWRVTIYVGDSREDVDAALEEALRVDERLRGVA
jgi:phosphoglycolate phosphatase-like HAD superfamily hydrolase